MEVEAAPYASPEESHGVLRRLRKHGVNFAAEITVAHEAGNESQRLDGCTVVSGPRIVAAKLHRPRYDVTHLLLRCSAGKPLNIILGEPQANAGMEHQLRLIPFRIHWRVDQQSGGILASRHV